MKTLRFSLSCFVLLLALGGCGRKSHAPSGPPQTFAILPFDVAITKNINVKKTTPEMLKEQEAKEAYQYQNGVFQFMMANRKDFTVNFQDVDDTNALLKRKGMDYQGYKTLTKAEIAALLRVDGILMGKMRRKEVMPQAGAYALSALRDNLGDNLPFSRINANEMDVSLSLYSVRQGGVAWTHEGEKRGDYGKTPEDLGRELMAQAAKKFPYRK